METESQWFVIQTLSGHEMKVRDSMNSRHEIEEMQDYIDEILVPMEKVTEVRQGKKTSVNRKFFPGYIMVKITLYDEHKKLNDRVWTFINETNSVIGFLGGDNPTPLSPSEVSEIMDQLTVAEDAVKPKIDFEVNEIVKIRDGAFANFEGKIESIDPERGKLKLSVSIFGRSTPVEVEYWQVQRE
jgi:transcription termination/antitermination protein NusG